MALASLHDQIHTAMSSVPIPAVVSTQLEAAGNVLKSVHQAVGEPSVTVMLASSAVALGVANYVRGNYLRPANAPTKVPSQVPWLGCIFAFGERPIDFMVDNYNKYGPVHSFTMFGTDVTYLLGSEASSRFWGTHNDILNAEDLYANITVPVFGEGIAYAVEHKIFSEQKQMAKEALTQHRFASYTSVIEAETLNFISKWGDSGEFDFFDQMAKMIIYTATNCLHGKETRATFDESVAKLYHALDGGFTPQAWFLPPWLPLPSFRRRDAAHKELKSRFMKIVSGRRERGEVKVEGRTDLMEVFMTVPYRKVLNGRNMTDSEVSGMLIALLMAGQHTSSTVSSWMMCFICTVPGLQEELYEEQVAAFKQLPGPMSMSHLDLMPLLHACVRETLRLRPPIMTIMRKARQDFEVKANGKTFVVPKGSQVCVSPTVNGRLADEWDEPMKFDPHRFLKTENGKLVVTAGEQITKGGKFKWVPFGAGRHRCIGFEFAQLQIRCVMSTVLRNYKIELKTGKLPKINYTTMIHTPTAPIVKFTKRT
eukprot:m.75954 g.75954  ORF g.75954 m.75954 type:complete len:538 (+) comp14413_c0_seq1:91-1704(+)